MTQSSLDPTRRFSTRAEFYARARPRYPRALLEFCCNTLKLKPTHRIADIGSGTGFLSELFLQNGNQVFAVEPNEEMRKKAQAALATNPQFVSINATAEATELEDASVDFIIAGQAFHWFDPAPRSPRIRPNSQAQWLGPDRLERTSHRAWKILRGLRSHRPQILRRQKPWRTPGNGHWRSDRDEEFLCPWQMRALPTFDHSQSLDLSGLESLLLSASHMPLPGDARCDEMLQMARDTFARFQSNGQVVLEYDTNVFYGHLNPRT